MGKFERNLILSFCLLSVLGGATTLHAEEPEGEDGDTERRYKSVREVPWMNRTYGTDRLVNGYYQEFDESVSDTVPAVSVTILSVSFGDATGDGTEEALLIFGYAGGGAGNFLEAEVLELNDGKPELLGEIEGGDRAEGGIGSFEARDGAVVVGRFGGIGACCPQWIEFERWRWTGDEFKQDGVVGQIERVDRKQMGWRLWFHSRWFWFYSRRWRDGPPWLRDWMTWRRIRWVMYSSSWQPTSNYWMSED